MTLWQPVHSLMASRPQLAQDCCRDVTAGQCRGHAGSTGAGASPGLSRVPSPTLPRHALPSPLDAAPLEEGWAAQPPPGCQGPGPHQVQGARRGDTPRRHGPTAPALQPHGSQRCILLLRALWASWGLRTGTKLPLAGRRGTGHAGCAVVEAQAPTPVTLLPTSTPPAPAWGTQQAAPGFCSEPQLPLCKMLYLPQLTFFHSQNRPMCTHSKNVPDGTRAPEHSA